MIERLNTYDWKEAFYFAAEKINPTIENPAHTHQFVHEDVKEFIAADEGEIDRNNWIAICKLKDERYIFISAGCYFTGWDMQPRGLSYVSTDLGSLIKYGLRDQDRERLRDSIILKLAGVE